MSGTGGTVYDATAPAVSCERLNFRTVLNSPAPAVVAEIDQNFGRSANPIHLEISIEKRGDLRIAVASYLNRVAGAITSDALLQLIECIEDDYQYVAEVKNISGARVEVQVFMRPPQ